MLDKNINPKLNKKYKVTEIIFNIKLEISKMKKENNLVIVDDKEVRELIFSLGIILL